MNLKGKTKSIDDQVISKNNTPIICSISTEDNVRE